MSSYCSYECCICNADFKQKSHIEDHIKSKSHKKEAEIFSLKLEKLKESKLLKKYNSTDIKTIVDNLSFQKIETSTDISSEEENYMSISSKEAMKDAIHEIHNFLRNNGAGYGMNALKLFTLFYGLAKIEKNGHFEKTGLNNICKFSNIVKSFKKDKEITMDYLHNNIFNEIYENDKVNRMLVCEIPESITPNTIKTLVDQVNRLVCMESEMNFQLAGKIYEYFIGRDQTAISELGAYFTDRHITDYIYQNVHQPTLDENSNVESMIDMFGGSGGFTLGYVSHLIENYPDIDWSKQLNNIYHMDMNLDVVKYAMLELYCLTGEFPERDNLMTINSFQDDFVNQDGKMKFMNIYTNPPYGGDKINKSETVMHMELIKKTIENALKSKYKLRNLKAISKVDIEEKDKAKLAQYDTIYKKLKDIEKENKSKTVSLNNSSKRFQLYAKENKIDGSKCKDKEAVSFLMMMDLLEKGGTAVGVLKEGLFFDSKYAHLRKHCVENFNIEKIVSIDASQFENTTTKTSIIKFSNTGKTKKIKFYEMIVDKEDKTELVEKEDGTFDIDTIKDRIVGVSDKLVAEASYQDLVDNDFTFNYKKYNIKELKPGKGYKLVRLGEVSEIINGNQLDKNEFVNGKYPVYGGSIKPLGYHNNYNSENTIIITGTGTYGEIIYEKKKCWASQCFTITPFKDINFYYYLLTCLKKNIKYKARGSNQKFLRSNDFIDFKIPIPESDKKIKYWVDRINGPYNTIQDSKEKLVSLEEEVQSKIRKILQDNETEDVILGELCDFKSGVKFTMSQYYMKSGKYGYIRIQNLNDSINMIYLSDEGYSKCKNNLVSENDILLSDVTENTFVKIVPKEWNKFVNYGSVIRCFNHKINKMYLYYFFKSNEFNEKRICKESGSIQKHLTLGILNSIKITLPKNRKLIDTLNPLFDQIDKINEIILQQEKLYQQYLDELKNEAIINDDNNNLLETTSESKEENIFSKSIKKVSVIEKKNKKKKNKSKSISV